MSKSAVQEVVGNRKVRKPTTLTESNGATEGNGQESSEQFSALQREMDSIRPWKHLFDLAESSKAWPTIADLDDLPLPEQLSEHALQLRRERAYYGIAGLSRMDEQFVTMRLTPSDVTVANQLQSHAPGSLGCCRT